MEKNAIPDADLDRRAVGRLKALRQERGGSPNALAARYLLFIVRVRHVPSKF